MTNEELKQKIQEDEKRDFREYAERELSGCGTFGSISENLSALADCVGYVPPRWHMTEGFHILRIGGQVDTE